MIFSISSLFLSAKLNTLPSNESALVPVPPSLLICFIIFRMSADLPTPDSPEIQQTSVFFRFLQRTDAYRCVRDIIRLYKTGNILWRNWVVSLGYGHTIQSTRCRYCSLGRLHPKKPAQATATDYRLNKAHKFTEHCMYRLCLWLYAYQPILGGVAYKEPKPHPK